MGALKIKFINNISQMAVKYTLKYEIISSGSKGNCVIINDVMIDCGVPFGKIKEHLYDMKYLLLTHVHSDHIKKATLDNIKKMFPVIKTIGNYEVHQKFGVDQIANAGFQVQTLHYNFEPFECVHDVLTYGFAWDFEGVAIIYATDTSSMEFAPQGPFDYLFVESNHSEKKLEMVNEAKGGYNPYLGGKRHLSTEQAKAFYYTHRRSRESEFIELHKSERFY